MTQQLLDPHEFEPTPHPDDKYLAEFANGPETADLPVDVARDLGDFALEAFLMMEQAELNEGAWEEPIVPEVEAAVVGGAAAAGTLYNGTEGPGTPAGDLAWREAINPHMNSEEHSIGRYEQSLIPEERRAVREAWVKGAEVEDTALAGTENPDKTKLHFERPLDDETAKKLEDHGAHVTNDLRGSTVTVNAMSMEPRKSKTEWKEIADLLPDEGHTGRDTGSVQAMAFRRSPVHAAQQRLAASHKTRW